MKKYAHIKEKALKLRANNKSLDEITEMLKVPRTTVYYWVKDVPIERTEKQNNAQKIGTEAMKKKYRKLREEAYEEGVKLYKKLKKEKTFIDFVTIYLTEGYRKNRNVASVSNSNKNIIKLSYLWFKKLNFNGKSFIFNIQIHEDQDEKEVKKYWSKILNIKTSSIKTIRKSNSGKLNGRNWRSKYGVLSVTIQDTYLRSRIQAWMDCLEKDWEESMRLL